MKLTPLERRERIHRLMESDEDYLKMKTEYDIAKEKFTRLTDRLPKKWSSFLWAYPGMGYFLHHRMLTIICEKMKFPDEE